MDLPDTHHREDASDTREHPIRPIDVPASLHALLHGRVWARNVVGEAGASVYRVSAVTADASGVTGAPANDLYLKHGCGSAAADVLDEAVRLRWLAGHITVPTVRAVFVTPTDDGASEETWMLMDALVGQTAYQWLAAQADAPQRQEQIVDALVAFLQRLHAIPVETCPFINDHERRLVTARARLDAGVVDEDDFGKMHEGWTAQQVWDAMIARLPLATDAVVTHGDYSLDNVLMTANETLCGFTVVGCIDAGRVGVADRYQDLAVLWDCLEEFGDALQARTFSQYGIRAVDENKLRFYLALDEFV